MAFLRFTGPSGARRIGIAAMLIVTGFAVAGCSIGTKGKGSLRETLGLDKNAPDEFAVVTKAPLVVPPNYDLRPPQKGAPPLSRVDPRLAARESVFGGTGGRSKGASRGESALLDKIGTGRADPDIRRTLNKENASLAEKDKKLTSKVLFWQKGRKRGAVIDARAEAARLKANKKHGKPVTEGATTMVNCDGKKSASSDLNCK